MNLNKTSFVLGNALGAALVGIVVVACGGDDNSGSSSDSGGGGGGSGGGGSGILKASNVIVRPGVAVASFKDGIVRVQANQLPDNVRVLAANVALETTANDLTATDLQTALDKEMAVDIRRTIVGLWDVENYTARPGGCITYPTGRVEIRLDGTYDVITGTFDAAQDEAEGTPPSGGVPGPCKAHHTRTYKVVGKGVYFTSIAPLSSGDTFVPSPASITEATVNTMTLQSTSGLTRLTRVVPRTVSDPAPAAAPTMKVAVAMSHAD